MDKMPLSEKVQREILSALTSAYPDPISGRQYFALFGGYSESEMAQNINALVKKGLITQDTVRSCNGVHFVKLTRLTLTFEKFLSGRMG
jgi:hypothetical protein